VDMGHGPACQWYCRTAKHTHQLQQGYHESTNCSPLGFALSGGNIQDCLHRFNSCKNGRHLPKGQDIRPHCVALVHHQVLRLPPGLSMDFFNRRRQFVLTVGHLRHAFPCSDTPGLAASIYTGEGQRRNNFDTKIMNLDHFYRDGVAVPRISTVTWTGSSLRSATASPTDRLLIAVTEYQAWWLTERVDEDFRLTQALYLAGVFHALMRRSQQVHIGEIESLINVQGIVEVSQASLKSNFACLPYRHHSGSSVLATSTAGPMATSLAFLLQISGAFGDHLGGGRLLVNSPRQEGNPPDDIFSQAGLWAIHVGLQGVI